MSKFSFGDKNLDSAIANVLVSLVKVADQDLSQNNQKTDTTKDDDLSDVKPQYTLKELLAGASEEDFEGEYDWGVPVGKEIW